MNLKRLVIHEDDDEIKDESREEDPRSLLDRMKETVDEMLFALAPVTPNLQFLRIKVGLTLVYQLLYRSCNATVQI